MKTPEEIKKGIECCMCDLMERRCEKCPYADGGCESVACEKELGDDTVVLIQQFESQIPKWISVEERLPEDVEYVLCWYKDEFGGEWSTVGMKVQWGCGWDLDIDDGSGRNLTVTHWMPMPEPPKEEEHAAD